MSGRKGLGPVSGRGEPDTWCRIHDPVVDEVASVWTLSACEE